ncbi:unnamed protein product [Durusdinium trenchii]|uniref:DNA topoisomerase n=1 Tax=Durusdinium trenchii TaxID=1381693 RepID=A0ABP0P884_9DINO
MQPYPGFGCANGQLGFGQAGQVMFGDPYAQGQWNQQQGYSAPVANLQAPAVQQTGSRTGKGKSKGSGNRGGMQPASGFGAAATTEESLSGFDAMSAAASSYVKKAPKQVKAPAEMNVPNYEEKNTYRLKNNIRAWHTDGSTKQVPDPYGSYSEAKLPRALLDAFKKANFQAPTPIQAQVWPILDAGWDVIGIAKTGSGKTLGFLVPAYRWMWSSPSSGVRTLILAPTRELATQIHDEATKFASASGCSSACVYGGQPKKEQLPAVRAGAPILVATPGRLNDFLEYKDIHLGGVGYAVFDEADRMLDMGFEPQIRDIMKKVPKNRQTLMFSATWPEEVQQLAHDFLNTPIHVQVGNTSALSANEDISQEVWMLNSADEKDGALVEALRLYGGPGQRVLVFVAMKKQCDMVMRMLRKCSIAANTMHSDKDQAQREEALHQFKSGETSVLIATDVAARGLDIKGVTMVVNYDSANSAEDHVHRIGRTGRAGQKGYSITFLTKSGEDAWKAIDIAEVMKKAGSPVPPEMQQVVDQMLWRRQKSQANDNRWDHLPKVLMVAEKPSVAKLIAEFLSGGRMRFRKGQSRAVQIYEFNSYFPPAHQQCRIMQTSTIGHVFGLDFKDNRPKDIADLFHDPCKKTIEDNTAKNRIVEHFQELAAEADYLALWLDCDKEGENICFEVISLCENIPKENIYRAQFSALTEPELKGAFNNLGRPDKLQAQSVDARQELDLKIGCIFTRLMTRQYLRYAVDKFRLRDQTCLSYGPCQTPTLWFCVERHKEIQSFQRQEFFKPKASITLDGWPLEFDWLEGQTFDKGRIQSLQSRSGSAKQAVVQDLRSTMKTLKKPVGLNTVQLLKAASTGLGMSPVQCMKVAEHLYTSGYISYPRTETTRYSDTFDLHAALREQADHPAWGKTVSHLLRQGQIRNPKTGRDVGDHPPITPMKAAPRDEFSKGSEWRLYDYITRHFISSLMPDVQYEEKALIVKVAGEDFCYTYHEMRERGFLFAMPWKTKDLHLNEIDWQMPRLSAGTSLAVQEVWVESDFTKPPDYLKESELVALMDKHGIGTDASIPQHVENICNRNYVMVCGPGEDGQRGERIPKGGKKGKGKGKGKEGKSQGEKPQSRHMVPTALGLSFCAAFEELDGELCRPPIRAYMEKQCAQVAEGILEKEDVVNENIKLFETKFQSFRNRISQLDKFFVSKDQIANTMGYRGGGADWGSGGWSSNGWSNGWGGTTRSDGGRAWKSQNGRGKN